MFFLFLSQKSFADFFYDSRENLQYVDLNMLTLRNRIVSNDPELVYENKPNFKYYDGKEWVNLTNSLGLMDREYPLNKSNNTFRILALGDSVTEGYLLPSPEAAYSKQLEKMLNNNLKGYNFEVINAGVGGYNSRQEIRLFEVLAPKLKPDLVILEYSMGDTASAPKLKKVSEDTYRLEYYSTTFPTIMDSEINAFLVEHSAAYKFFMKKITNILKKIGEEELIKYYNIGYKKDKEAFNKLKKISNQIDAEVVIFIFPYFEDFNNYTHLEEHDYIKKIAKEAGIDYVDLFDTFKQYEYKELRTNKYDSMHPNEFGNQIASKAIYDAITKKKLIPNIK